MEDLGWKKRAYYHKKILANGRGYMINFYPPCSNRQRGDRG